MKPPRLQRLVDVAPQFWRNGGGTTRELLAWPAPADWSLRLSVADVERDGPFSAFPGTTRWFAVLHGAGVVLELDGPCRIGPADAPLRFDGALAPACRLVDGPTRDLNLMLRGIAGRLLPVMPGLPCHGEAPLRGLYAATAGRWAAAGATLDLEADTLLWQDAAAPGPTQFDGRGWWIEADPAEPAR